MRPKPKAEIIVNEFVTDSSILEIYTSSMDAANFVESEAGQYGALTHIRTGLFHLTVSAMYDHKEVAEYLRSMGK